MMDGMKIYLGFPCSKEGTWVSCGKNKHVELEINIESGEEKEATAFQSEKRMKNKK
jgi:hypothetical protein